MSFSNYLENKILNHIAGKATYTPETWHIALSTADPGEDGSAIAEPSGNGYARVQTAPADWNTSTAGLLDNANVISFPEATGSWGTITHFAIFSASSGGNFLGSGALTESKAIGSGDTLKFAAGDCNVTQD